MKRVRLLAVIALPLLVVALSAIYPVPGILAQRESAAAFGASASVAHAGQNPSASCVVTGAVEGVDVSDYQSICYMST